MNRSHRLALAAASALALAHGPALAAEKCHDFSQLAADAGWGVNTSLPIDIGEVHVRPLVIDGKPFEAENQERQVLRLQDPQIAGGQRPELHGSQIAMQIVPSGAESAWHAGTLGVRSTQGGIEQVTIGAQFMRVDNVCIEH